MQQIDKYKPAVPKTFLLILAGIVWECVGIMLLSFACSWLSATPAPFLYLHSGIGIVLALVIHHFGFLKIVDRNLNRILQMDGKKCLFSFFPRKSYLLIVVMASIGAVLRHSMIQKEYLAILYIGIGLALALSSIRYFRIFYQELKKG
jgi:hypothetical protein